MISALKDALKAAETWPEEDQEALLEAARDIEAQRSGVYEATPEGLGEERCKTAESSDLELRRPSTPFRLERARRRRRIFYQHRRRPDRARRKVAAAIRAASIEPRLDAVAAERALERADHRVCGF